MKPEQVLRGADSQIPGILLLIHGRVDEELIRSAEIIVGTMENVHALLLLQDQDIGEYQNAVAKKAATLPKGSVIMADLFGGTPSNCAAVLSRQY